MSAELLELGLPPGTQVITLPQRPRSFMVVLPPGGSDGDGGWIKLTEASRRLGYETTHTLAGLIKAGELRKRQIVPNGIVWVRADEIAALARGR